jgi:tetratricopeptide (TPR) repeat protein
MWRKSVFSVCPAAAVAMVAVVGLFPAEPAHADLGSSAGSDKPAIETARDAIEDGDYRKAVNYLKGHLRDNDRDADALNLMGFSLRKLKKYDSAEKYYLRALEIEPEHLGANEYLGELYLQTDRPALARERQAVLKKACPDTCTERQELDQALARYSSGEGP